MTFEYLKSLFDINVSDAKVTSEIKTEKLESNRRNEIVEK